MLGKKAVGKPRLKYLKQVAKITGGDSYTAIRKNDLQTNPDGKLPTNQKTEG